tara:strand:- start:113 stop:262 length:150 start_codon:yes stop_codon:yes gene_type:complete
MKVVTIDGHLVKLDERGTFFRLNGLGVWTQISTKDLYNLITHIDEKEID